MYGCRFHVCLGIYGFFFPIARRKILLFPKSSAERKKSGLYGNGGKNSSPVFQKIRKTNEIGKLILET